eukprot:scaffold45296_cov87-Phaeocystis_antarctica.AAC.1
MAGLLVLAAGLARGLAAPNAQLRRLNLRVGEALHGGAACSLPTGLAAMGRGEVGGLVGGVSSFGYSGTITHALLQSTSGATAVGQGGGAALRFRRRAFPWATAAKDALDSSAIALYNVGWAELAASTASSPGGQWLAVQPAGTSGVAARVMRAALSARVRLVSEPLGGAVGTRAWRGVALLLDAADNVAPCVRGVQSA